MHHPHGRRRNLLIGKLTCKDSMSERTIYNVPQRRIHEAISAGATVVDVDGSYLYKKHKTLTEAGHRLAPLTPQLHLHLAGDCLIGKLSSSCTRLTNCHCWSVHHKNYKFTFIFQHYLYRFGVHIPRWSCWSVG